MKGSQHQSRPDESPWTLETILTCLYPYTVQTRPLAGTASGMASDSVRGRGNICGADLDESPVEHSIT